MYASIYGWKYFEKKVYWCIYEFYEFVGQNLQGIPVHAKRPNKSVFLPRKSESFTQMTHIKQRLVPLISTHVLYMYINCILYSEFHMHK